MIEHKLKKGDLILIALILFLALILWGGRSLLDRQNVINGNSIATINVDGEVYKTVELTKETQYLEIRTERGYDILKIHDNGIEVVESDCPQKICFTFGFIQKPSETIICIPLRMYIEIKGDPGPANHEVDAIVG
ncbi:hypothetical protein D3C76_206540 [compost metagenome]